MLKLVTTVRHNLQRQVLQLHCRLTKLSRDNIGVLAGVHTGHTEIRIVDAGAKRGHRHCANDHDAHNQNNRNPGEFEHALALAGAVMVPRRCAGGAIRQGHRTCWSCSGVCEVAAWCGALCSTSLLQRV